jgi:hypothetical protein
MKGDAYLAFAPCAVCRREGDAFLVTPVGGRAANLCSPECARLHMTRTLNPNEREAAIAGGARAGAWLDRIGKSDLEKLSPDEWAEFCGILFAEACEALRRAADDGIPF